MQGGREKDEMRKILIMSSRSKRKGNSRDKIKEARQTETKKVRKNRRHIGQDGGTLYFEQERDRCK